MRKSLACSETIKRCSRLEFYQPSRTWSKKWEWKQQAFIPYSWSPYRIISNQLLPESKIWVVCLLWNWINDWKVSLWVALEFRIQSKVLILTFLDTTPWWLEPTCSLEKCLLAGQSHSNTQSSQPAFLLPHLRWELTIKYPQAIENSYNTDW